MQLPSNSPEGMTGRCNQERVVGQIMISGRSWATPRQSRDISQCTTRHLHLKDARLRLFDGRSYLTQAHAITEPVANTTVFLAANPQACSTRGLVRPGAVPLSCELYWNRCRAARSLNQRNGYNASGERRDGQVPHHGARIINGH